MSNKINVPGENNKVIERETDTVQAYPSGHHQKPDHKPGQAVNNSSGNSQDADRHNKVRHPRSEKV